MSAEPGRKKAYGIDLRWRVVYQRIGMNLTYDKIATNLNIAASTAYSIFTRFQQTGKVDPVLSEQRRELRKLSVHEEIYTVGMVLEDPSMYLSEVCHELEEAMGVVVTPPTICRLLRRYGITRKKIQQVALQRCYTLRGAFMAQCLLFNPDQFVFIDETGSDARDHIRKYGYAIRGLAPQNKRLLSRGQRVNAIAGMSTDGVVAVEVTKSNVDAEVFFDYARRSLIPNMLPFNGSNPCSIVIMDNLSVHHTQDITHLFRQMGILLLFLPPYSPDLNPAEEMFSFVKNYLRKHDNLLQIVTNPTDIIHSAFDSITSEHCTAWVRHSGYSK